MQFIDPDERRGEKERKCKKNGEKKQFRGRDDVKKNSREENETRISEKCDNKNEIYELRLVIYLCANLLLHKKLKGRTRVRLYCVR